MSIRVVCLVMALTGLLAPTAMATSGTGPQPDVLVRYDGNGHSHGPWKGADVYKLSRQHLHEPSRKRSVFEFKVENDGHAAFDFYVGAITHQDSQFDIAFSAGGTDITNDIETGLYRTGLLKPGKSKVIKAVIIEGGGQPPAASLSGQFLASTVVFGTGGGKGDGVTFSVGGLAPG